MSKTVQLRKKSYWSVLVYACLAVLVGTLIYVRLMFYLTGDIRALVSNVPDDAAYFYKIALNLVSGRGMSFDGINLTNGFQPLWLYALTPLAWLMREKSPEALFRAALIYQMMFVIIAGGFVFYASRIAVGLPIALIATTLYYLIGRHFLMNGMETGVLVFCLGSLLAYSIRYRVFSNVNPRTSLVFGVLAGLLLLARLDMVLLVGSVYLFVLLSVVTRRHNRESSSLMLRDLLISAAGTVIVIFPYFIYNKLVFGDFMPISGQLKNTFPHVSQPEFGPPRFALRDLAMVLLSASFLLWSAYRLRQRRHDDMGARYFVVTVMIGSLAVILHYFHTALFMKWAVFAWHFAFYYVVGCLIVAAVLSDARWCAVRQSTAVCSASAVVVALLAVAYLWFRSDEPYHRRSWHASAYEAAVWVRNNLDRDAVLALKDAGIFGLFSQRSVVNLDGLVNNMEFQHALRDKRLNEYLARKRVQYLAYHVMWRDTTLIPVVLRDATEFFDISYRSNKYDVFSEPVRVYRRKQVYRSQPYHDGKYYSVYVIWKLQ